MTGFNTLKTKVSNIVSLNKKMIKNNELYDTLKDIDDITQELQSFDFPDFIDQRTVDALYFYLKCLTISIPKIITKIAYIKQNKEINKVQFHNEKVIFSSYLEHIESKTLYIYYLIATRTKNEKKASEKG